MTVPVPRKILKEWAKEMLLEAMDYYIKDVLSSHACFDDRRALEVERDRVAKFFNLPVKY